MASIWASPASGDLLNSGQPWRHGDTLAIQFLLDSTHRLYSDVAGIQLIGGVLPPGAYFNGATNKLSGTLLPLPKGTTSYPVVFRVSFKTSTRTYDRSFNIKVDPVDEEQHWSVPLGSVDLGTYNRGSGVTIPLDIVNPDADPLVYTAVGYNAGTGFQGLPVGLALDSQGRIVGAPTITDNQPGTYYFKVYVRSPAELLSNPRGEGVPRTSEKIYSITLAVEIVLDARLSDAVKWDTPAGSLGSTYETYPSHFSVVAEPEYQISDALSSESQMISYTLIPSSNPLPDGLILDTLSGLILGRCPYVDKTSTYDFTIEARVVFVNNDTGAIRPSTIASQRTFSITIRNIYITNSSTSVKFAIPPRLRSKLAQWISGNRAELREENLSVEGVNIPASQTANSLQILSAAQVFRAIDPLFGRVPTYKTLLVTGLYYGGSGFQDYLTDYHHPFTLRAGPLSTARAYSLDGQYIYDVIYLSLLDPLQGAGGFDGQSREVLLKRYAGASQTAIPEWNLPATLDEYYPSSVRNLRLDLIDLSNRLAGQTGIGLSGTEGLPLWMLCEQTPGDPTSVLGYQCAVELVYVRAGSGPGIVKVLTQAGFNLDVEGETIEVDRYLLETDGFRSMTFDFDVDANLITDFDGPDNITTPTTNMTTFDRQLESESKYYKFPPGEV